MKSSKKTGAATTPSLANSFPTTASATACVLAGNTHRPLAVLGTTRNLSTGDLATAKWLGAEDKLRGMLGLKIGEGQKVQMDGSAHQASDNDIGEDGKVVKWAREGRNGVAGGKTSTKMMLPYDTE